MSPLIHILIILCILPFCFSGCAVIDNKMISWSGQNGNEVKFEFYETYEKWFAFGLNNQTNTINGSVIFLYFEDELHEYRGDVVHEKLIWVRKLNYTKTYFGPGKKVE